MAHSNQSAPWALPDACLDACEVQSHPLVAAAVPTMHPALCMPSLMHWAVTNPHRRIPLHAAWQRTINHAAAPPLSAAPQLKVCTVPAAVSPAPLKTPPGAATPPSSAGVKSPAGQSTPTLANKPTVAMPSTVKAAPLAVKGAISEDSGVAFLPSASGSLKVSSSNKP